MLRSLSIWHGRQFTPLWCSQFLSALNDNLFRYAFNTALIFGVIAVPQTDAKLLVSLSAALFILPYLFISGLAGQLADKYPKAMLLRWNRGLEIIVFGVAGYALMAGQIPLLLVCLVLIGALAAFYGPVKHAITPELLPQTQLIAANGAIEAGTYAAILFGTLLGTSIIAAGGSGPAWSVALMLLVAIAAWLFSLRTPDPSAAAPQLKIDWNVPRQTWDLLRWGAEDSVRLKLLLGHAWFWFVGAAVLSQLTIFVKEDLHSVPELNTLLLALFACGIGLGGWLCNYLLRGQISPQYVSLAALGMAFWSLVLAGLAYAHPPLAGDPLTLSQFLAQDWSWVLLLAVVLMAACAGLYVVPLVSLLQTCVPEDQRARLLSLANIWFALFIIASSLMSSAIIGLGGQAKTVFATIGLLTLWVAVYLLFLLPRHTLKGIFVALLRALYRVEVHGLEHLAAAGPSAVIVANHQSYLDGILLGAFLPGRPVFAIDPIAASRWWAKPMISLVDMFTLNPTEPLNMRQLIHRVQGGRHCVIFPEGRLTETGNLMKINAGPAMIAEKSGAPIIPVRLDGPQYSPFGYLRGTYPIRWFPKITLHILSPEHLPSTAHHMGATRRQAMAQNLYDVMTRMILTTQPESQNLWAALEAARKKYGAQHKILEDAAREPINYGELLTRARALGNAIARHTAPSEHVGVLLPTGIAGIVTFFALQSQARVPALLNYSAGVAAMNAALDAAAIKTVVTSRAFIEKGHLEHLEAAIRPPARIIYLEDLRRDIRAVNKLMATIQTFFCLFSKAAQKTQPDDTAVILFTSGSEGLPKGVALSHRNLISNVEQSRAVVAYTPQDIVFNALPMFHAFGLTGGILVPVLHGVKTFVHPAPLQYRVVPELIYQSNATIVFGTDTFLTGYAKTADNYDFYRVRMIFAGAEKLRPETRNLYAQKFGVTVYEGYGITECAPVVAVNTPMHNQSGSVGRLLPGMEYRLEVVPGIKDGAQLHVRGPNIMKGYYKIDQPGILQPLADGWYNTGDIVSIDAGGFVTILGRAKRFAKIGGEMISLSAVENYAAQCWPVAQHAAMTIPDTHKGEAIVIVTTESSATPAELARFMKTAGATELSIPRTLRIVATLPILGSGKIDYAALKSKDINQF